MRLLKMIAVLSATCALGLAQSAPPSSPVPGEERVALVIGNSSHPIAPLRNPVNDAVSMRVALAGIGFRVTVLKNATLEEMLRGVASFAQDVPEGAAAVVFFSGHAVSFEGESYLIPSDSDVRDRLGLIERSLRVSEIMDRLARSPARFHALILDSCRTDPFQGRGGNVESYSGGPGGYLAFASAPGRCPFDSSPELENNSVFTGVLVGELKKGKRGTTVDELFTRVRARVAELTKNQQIPWSSSGLLYEWFPFGK